MLIIKYTLLFNKDVRIEASNIRTLEHSFGRSIYEECHEGFPKKISILTSLKSDLSQQVDENVLKFKMTLASIYRNPHTVNFLHRQHHINSKKARDCCKKMDIQLTMR